MKSVAGILSFFFALFLLLRVVGHAAPAAPPARALDALAAPLPGSVSQ